MYYKTEISRDRMKKGSIMGKNVNTFYSIVGNNSFTLQFFV